MNLCAGEDDHPVEKSSPRTSLVPTTMSDEQVILSFVDIGTSISGGMSRRELGSALFQGLFDFVCSLRSDSQVFSICVVKD